MIQTNYLYNNGCQLCTLYGDIIKREIPSYRISDTEGPFSMSFLPTSKVSNPAKIYDNMDKRNNFEFDTVKYGLHVYPQSKYLLWRLAKAQMKDYVTHRPIFFVFLLLRSITSFRLDIRKYFSFLLHSTPLSAKFGL